MREWVTGEMSTLNDRRSNTSIKNLASVMKLGATVSPKPMLADRKNVLVVVHETSRTGAPILGWNIANQLSKRYNVFTVRCGDGPLTAEFEVISVSVCVQLQKEGIRRQPNSLLKLHSFEYAIINSTESRHLISICKQHRIPTLFLVHEFSSYTRPLQALI